MKPINHLQELSRIPENKEFECMTLLEKVMFLYKRLTRKQNTLISGKNIMTINGTDILQSGNLEIESGTAGVLYINTSGESGNLTPEDIEKLNVENGNVIIINDNEYYHKMYENNIYYGFVNVYTVTTHHVEYKAIYINKQRHTFTKEETIEVIDYNDLINKPTLNGVVLSGNVYSSDLGIDWDDIHSKPTIPTKTSELTNDSGFIKNDKTILSNYQPVEFIESSGTQYIDSGYKPNGNTKIITRAIMTHAEAGNTFLYGSRTGVGIAGFTFGFNSKVIFGYGTRNIFEYNINSYIEFPLNIEESDTLYLNSVKIYSVEKETFNSNSNLTIFCLNTNNNKQFHSSARIYSMKIYDNNVLVRDFIPCYRLSDNEIGLYDLKNNVFYSNSGTGTFIKGNNVDIQDHISNQDISNWNNKQNTLINGKNIKSINNQSILGAGNINIQGGSGTNNYEELNNRPSINNVTLSGNKTLEELGINNITPSQTIDSSTSDVPSNNAVKTFVEALGTIQEIGSNSNGQYVKYSNGLMICTKSISAGASFVSGVYFGSGNTHACIRTGSLGNWAVNFTEIWGAWFSESQNIGSAYAMWEPSIYNGWNTTSCGQIAGARIGTTNNGQNCNFKLLAIGKWK